jgi:hypothetical protein
MQPTREQKLRDAFLVFGAQYYAHARYSAQYFYLPVCATLFHHAIEMLLKGYLCMTISSEELKKIGHDLVTLWDRFKDAVGHPQLAGHDPALRQLDKVELLRYPDSIVDDGYALHIGLGGPPNPIVFPDMEVVPRYSIQVSELDAIAATIFEACGVAPEPHFRSAPTSYLEALPPSLWRRNN